MKACLNAVRSQMRGQNIPVVVTSTYRSAARNRAVGGASGSQHLSGNAVDVAMRELDTSQRIKLVDCVLQNSDVRGFGYYPNSQSIHFDVRTGNKMAWGTNYSSSSIGQGWPDWLTKKVRAWQANQSPSSVGQDDPRQGEQKGNTDTKDGVNQTKDSKAPLTPSDKTNSATGESTRSAASRLPTHEPWDGHPKSQKAMRSGDSASSSSSDGATNDDGTSTNNSGNTDPTYQTQGDNKALLETIKGNEGGNYNEHKPKLGGGTASGAYQFIDSTWQTQARAAGVNTTQYPRAYMAPPAVQDKVADHYVSSILAKNGGDVGAVANTWYTGNAAGNMSAKQLAANNGFTAAQYRAKFLKNYQKNKAKEESKAKQERGDPGNQPAQGGEEVGSSSATSAPSTPSSGVSVDPNTPTS